MSAKTKARLFKVEVEATMKLCQQVDTPRALAIYLSLKYQQYEEILGFSCNPDHYFDSRSFRDDYQVTAMLQKNPRLPTHVDKKAIAIGKWHATELACAQTNRRLSEYEKGESSPPLDIHRAIHYAREEIRSVLGHLSRKDLGFVEDNCRFGPGSTTSVSGVVTQGKKYSPRALEATPRVAQFRWNGFPELWKTTAHTIRCVHSSKLTTVPKNAKTDRVICIEPDLNIYIQLGFGALLRERLLRSGRDLRNQRWNQYLAMRAVDFNLTTMDLSSASDTISRGVVWHLLPDTWANALFLSRTDSVLFDGATYILEKWSSMGNGYTFELESLIFHGILMGCLRSQSDFDGVNREDALTAVYGDDLIFPSDVEGLVSRTLDFLGFSVNTDKTFGTGRFRESCGSDWFDGDDVRPVFFRTDDNDTDFESACFLYANSLRRRAHRNRTDGTCDVRYLAPWLSIYTSVHEKRRLRIPEGFGDVGFITDFDRACPTLSRRKRRDGWCGYTFRYWKVRSVEKVISPLGAYISALANGSGSFTRGSEALRGRFQPPTIEEGYCLQWPNLGPWA